MSTVAFAAASPMASWEGLPKVAASKAVFGPFSDYQEVSRLALHLLEKYPPSQYLYVGIGRSPTPVMAFLAGAIDPGLFVNVPLSGLGALGWYRKNPELDLNRFYASRSAELDHHLANYLPAPEKLEGRDLLIIDYVFSGQSLVEAQIQLRSYYQRHAGSASPQLRSVGFVGWGAKAQTLDLLSRENIDMIRVGDAFQAKLIGRDYRRFAEYEPFYVLGFDSANYQPPRRISIGFAQLAEFYRLRVSADRDLKLKLQRLYPSAKVLSSSMVRGALDRLSCQLLMTAGPAFRE